MSSLQSKTNSSKKEIGAKQVMKDQTKNVDGNFPKFASQEQIQNTQFQDYGIIGAKPIKNGQDINSNQQQKGTRGKNVQGDYENVFRAIIESDGEDDLNKSTVPENTNTQDKVEVTSQIDLDFQFPQPTLRYGDIITITFDKKIEKENKISLFNGILYSNGVTKLNLDIISSNFQENREAFCNFKCTLFRIESCSSFAISQKIETLKQKRVILEQDEELESAKNKELREQVSYQEESKNKLDSLIITIEALEKQLEQENLENQYLNDLQRGKKVLYGDQIVLRHIESDLFISLSYEAAEENGCIACKLMTIGEHSLLSIVPQDRLRKQGQIILYQDSFFIQSFIEPTANIQPKYLHTSLYKLEKDEEISKVLRSVLEVNGSSDTSSYKAKLFQPYNFLDASSKEGFLDENYIDENIFSGDVVKFFHKQSNGYLTVKMPDNIHDLEYNSRINAEKDEFKRVEEILDDQVSAIRKKNFKAKRKINSNDQNVQDEGLAKRVNLDAIRDQNQPQIVIEIDQKQDNKAKYMWEIQKLKPFVTKQLCTSDFYRIKHVQTGLYLCLKKKSESDMNKIYNALKNKDQTLNNNSIIDQTENQINISYGQNVELALRELSDEYEFLFGVQKEAKVDDSGAIKNEIIKNLNLIMLGSHINGLKVQATLQSLDYLNSNKEIKNNIFNQSDTSKSAEIVEVRCLEEAKERKSRMLFTIIKTKKSHAQMVRAASNLFRNALKFFHKLNNFAEVNADEAEELNNNTKDTDLIEDPDKKSADPQQKDYRKEDKIIPEVRLGKSIDGKDIKVYVYKKAKAKEAKLQKVAKAFTNNLSNLKQTLRYLSEEDMEQYRLYQIYLDDAGILDMILTLLDLINIKTTPPDQRYLFSKRKRNFEYFRKNRHKFESDQQVNEGLRPYLKYLESDADIKLHLQGSKIQASNEYSGPQSQIKGKSKNTNDTPYFITNQIIRNIPAEILAIILLMITGNQKVDSKLDNYPGIMFQQLLGENIRKAKKIFKVSYGLSRLEKIRGDFESCEQANLKQVSNQKNLKRWIDLIFDPQYIDERNQNLKQQVIFFKVISLICQDQNGDGIFENQQLVFKKLLHKDNRVRQISFIIKPHYSSQSKKTEYIPYIQFSLRSRKIQSQYILEDQAEIEEELKSDQELFFKQNPHLKLLIDKADEKSSDYKKQRTTPPIKLLGIFDPDPMINQDYWPYAQYICAYLEMLITCIRNGQIHAKHYPNQVGLDAVFIFNVISNTKSNKLKIILIKFLTCLYINNDIIYGQYSTSNRCYYWSKITPDQMYHKRMQICDEDMDHEYGGEEQKEQYSKTKRDAEQNNQLSWQEQKKKAYQILPKMIQKILLVDQRWDDEENLGIDKEAEKATSDLYSKPKQLLSLMIAALECSIELIQCEKSNHVLIFNLIYASAIVFSWFRYRKNQDKQQAKTDELNDDEQKENRFKNFRLFKFLQKAKAQQSCKDLVDEVFKLLLQNLLAIGLQRTNHQIMIGLKTFRKSIEQSNESLNQRKKYQKLEVQEGLEDQNKKIQSFIMNMLTLYGLEANGFPVISEEFIENLKSEIVKNDCENLNKLYSSNGEKCLRYNVKEYLLFLIFDKKLNPEVKNMAFEVLMQNFEAQNYFIKEINQVFIVVDGMEEQYKSLQNKRYQILVNAQDIIWESFRVHHISREQKKSQKYVETFKNIKESLSKFEGQIENLMSELDFQDPNFKLKQQMLKFLDIPKLFINYIMKNIKYKRRLHLELFKLIMDFLYVYSHQNSENSESLISQLDFLSSLQQIDLQNEKLITQIVKQLKNQEKESQLIDHIIRQINRLSQGDNIIFVKEKSDYKDPLYYQLFPLNDDEAPELKSSRQICSLFKSLNLLAQNSIFNKGNIFNKILKLSKFYQFLFFSSTKARYKLEGKKQGEEKRGGDAIQECVKKYKEFIEKCREEKVDFSEINFNSNRLSSQNGNLENIKRVKAISLPRFTYILHRRVLSLLIQCCKDQQNSIPQVAKIIPLDSLLRTLKSIDTPYILKKKYLRLLLLVHLSQFDDQTNQTYFRDDSKLKKIFSLIIYEDLLEFPFALLGSLEAAKLKLIQETDQRDIQFKIAKHLLENENKLRFNKEAYHKLIEDENVKANIQRFKDLRSISQDIVERAIQDRIHFYNERKRRQGLNNQQEELLRKLETLHQQFQKQEDTMNEKTEPNHIQQQHQPQSSSGAFTQLPETNRNNEPSYSDIFSAEEQAQENQDIKIIEAQIEDTKQGLQFTIKQIQTLRSLNNPKDPKIPSDYSPSISMGMRDGLIHFIKDFFQSIKWDISPEDLDKFRDKVLQPLIDIKKRLESINSKNLSIVPGGDELLLKVEEAIDAINKVQVKFPFDEMYNRIENQTRNGRQDNLGGSSEGSSGYLKQATYYTPDMPLMKQNQVQPSSYKSEAQKLNQKNQNTAGKAAYENDRTYVRPLISDNQGFNLVPVDENIKLTKFYQEKVNEVKKNKLYQYQKEDRDDNFQVYYNKFNQHLIEKNIGLGELFGIQQTYDSTHFVKKDDFTKKIKEISLLDSGDNLKFYNMLRSFQNKKQREEHFLSFDDAAQQTMNSNGISLGLFGELLIKNYDENLLMSTKKALKALVRKGYQFESSRHLSLKRRLKDFINRVISDSNLKSENDLNKIISIIIETFRSQQKREDMVNFFDNMIAGLQVPDQRHYILQLLKGILTSHKAKSLDLTDKSDETLKNDFKRYQQVIHIMKDCKLSVHLIKYLNNSEPEEVSQLSIGILNLLLEGMNKPIQDQIYEFIKARQSEVEMAEYLKTQTELLSPMVIQDMFNWIKESNSTHLLLLERKNQKGQQKNENAQKKLILQDFEINAEDEKGKALIKLQEQRQNTIKKFCSILRFIQLLCDNCHLKFQNYFRDQLTLQDSEEGSSSVYINQIIQETVENTSSFNMIVIVSKCFMKITESLKDLIFFDKFEYNNLQAFDNKDNLTRLIEQFLDVMIDFLYGPCVENQFILANWQKLLQTIEFYLNNHDVYFFVQNYSQDFRFTLMHKVSILLLGIIENPDPEISKKLLLSLEKGINFQNLQKIMINIHRQKILGYEKSKEIFRTNRRYEENNHKVKVQLSKVYPKNSMRKSDKVTFEIGFNIFKFLYIIKRINPKLPLLQSELLSRQSTLRAQQMLQEMIAKEKKDYIARLYREKLLESELLLEFYKEQIILLHNQNDEKLTQDPEKLLNVFKFLQIRNIHIKSLERQGQELSSKSQLKQLLQGAAYNQTTSMNSLISIEKPLNNSKMGQSTNDDILMNLSTMDGNSLNVLDQNDEQYHLIIKKLIAQFQKIDEINYKKLAQKQVHEFEDQSDYMTTASGNAISLQQGLEYLQLEKALEFYTEYTAEVEVDYKNILVRSIFQIPSKCAFLSAKSRKEILYGNQNNSLFDKLESLFQQMNILIAEMKSNQRLSRKSKARYWISISTTAFQRIATVLIVIINLIYLIFYVYDVQQQEEIFTNSSVKTIVLVLAIAQAIISFFIHLGYIEKYHCAYYKRYKEKQQQQASQKFTELKGSLGYAEGTRIKQEYKEIVPNEIQNALDQLKRQQKKQRQRVENLYKNFEYGVKIYLIGLNEDSVHAFNLVILVCSILAIAYPFIFSVLLLENVLQIPLLYSVIKAIVNNRKQILLTLLLLLVVVYVYSFIAFIAFRQQYISSDLNENEEPQYNSYCSKLGLCFTSTLNNGVRSGGGIGDTLDQLGYDDNLYWGRYIFDLTFFVLVIVLLLNLIFGIIIDAFAEMRDQRNEVEREVQEKCFICGKSSSAFESKKKSFEDHIQREHNLYSYLYYIFYISRKPVTECTGVERYVQTMIISHDPNFFPINRSLSLDESPLEQRSQTQKAEGSE